MTSNKIPTSFCCLSLDASAIGLENKVFSRNDVKRLECCAVVTMHASSIFRSVSMLSSDMIFARLSHFTSLRHSKRMFIIGVFFLLLRVTMTDGLTIGVIHNASLAYRGANATVINGTCQQCLCALVDSAANFSSFSCFLNNHTCQMSVERFNTSSVSVRNDSTTVFYLLSPTKESKTSNSVGSRNPR